MEVVVGTSDHRGCRVSPDRMAEAEAPMVMAVAVATAPATPRELAREPHAERKEQRREHDDEHDEERDQGAVARRRGGRPRRR